MRRVCFLLLILIGSTVMAIGIKFYISNLSAYASVYSSSVKIDVGYPYSSIKLGKDSYIKLEFRESTPLMVTQGMWEIWKNNIFSIGIGAKANFGTLTNAFDNSKVQEFGRGYILANLDIGQKGVQACFLYSRFVLSMDKGLKTNSFFFLPPNYIGEAANAFSVYFRYGKNFSRKATMTLNSGLQIRMSDEGILSPPVFEIGFSISTTLENLKKSF